MATGTGGQSEGWDTLWPRSWQEGPRPPPLALSRPGGSQGKPWCWLGWRGAEARDLFLLGSNGMAGPPEQARTVRLSV